jgi:4-coumarate--CoA ligase
MITESAHCSAQEDTILHAEAHDPSLNITKADARTLTKQLAHVLRTQFDIGAQAPGQDVVLAVSKGQRQLPSLFYAVAATGGVYSAASTSSTASQLEYQIRHGPAKLLVCSDDMRDVAVEAAQNCELPLSNVLVLESCPELSLEAVTGEWKCELGAELDWERVTDPDVLEKRLLCLVYSSGTTGIPKGVGLTHRNLVAQAMIPAATNRSTYASRSEPHLVIRTLAHLPTAHISAVQGYFVNPFYDAGTVFWMQRFSFPDFLACCERLAITTLFTVPPIVMAIARHPMVIDQLRSLRIVYTGAAPINSLLQKAAGAKMGSGVFISQTWGMTEVCGGCTHMPPYETDGFVGSASPLMQNMLLRIVDDAGHDVPDGHLGEALLKGPLVTPGYHNNVSANKTGFLGNWLRTGDIVLVKDGTIFFVDRKTELIKYNGLQVAPSELEALLTNHPLIHDAAVIGVPNDERSNLLRAYVMADPQMVSEEEIQLFFNREVSEAKKLTGGVVFVQAIPRTPSGKILRGDLRDRASKEMMER